MTTADNQAPGPSAQTAPSALVTRAEQLVAQIVEGDFAAAAQSFAGPLRDQFPPDQLAQVWEGLVAQGGPFQQVTRAVATKILQYDAVVVICAFERGNISLQFIFDDTGHVVGLQAHPDASLRPPESYTIPPYARPDAFHEQDVQVGEGAWALPGTLTLPNGPGPFPAVVLVHGSGAHDRDETIQALKPFRDLAWGLATRGIAVLRYEKRTKQYGAEFAALPHPTVQEETVDDARAAVALLRRTTAIDPRRIFVLGHSLGGMLAPRIGAADPQIAGLVIMAGLTRPLEDTVLDQFTYLFSLDGPISPDQQRQLDTLKAQIAHIKDPALALDTPKEQLLNLPASYVLDLRGYSPPEAARHLRQPLLILQAERDYQVTMEDFRNWQAALADRPDVTFKSYPGLVHPFVPGEGTPADYATPQSIDAGVVADIAQWILQQPPAPE